MSRPILTTGKATLALVILATLSLTLFGDIRDLIIPGWKLATGDPDLGTSTAILSGAGVALTFVPLLDGTRALAKNAIKYVHRFPVFVEKGLIREFIKKTSPSMTPRGSGTCFIKRIVHSNYGFTAQPHTSSSPPRYRSGPDRQPQGYWT